MSPHFSEIIADKLDAINNLGFVVEDFGQNSWIIRGVPVFIGSHDPKDIVIAAIEDFESGKQPLQSEMEEQIVAGICKRIAIKGGQILSDVEQRTLLRELESCSAPRTCPHGRPTMIHLSVDLLERQFGRRGSR